MSVCQKDHCDRDFAELEAKLAEAQAQLRQAEVLGDQAEQECEQAEAKVERLQEMIEVALHVPNWREILTAALRGSGE